MIIIVNPSSIVGNIISIVVSTIGIGGNMINIVGTSRSSEVKLRRLAIAELLLEVSNPVLQGFYLTLRPEIGFSEVSDRLGAISYLLILFLEGIL